MTVYVITLPGVDTRYTAQWYEWVWNYALTQPKGSVVPLGTANAFKVRPTDFLSYREYLGYVAPLMAAALKLVKDGDTVFFMDGETPGAEALEYVRKMEGIDVKIRSFWHAGTYDIHDLTHQRGVQGEHFERGWFDMTEKVFVGSEYHKRLLNETRDVPLDKITVTGCPLDLEAFEDGSKTPKMRKFLFTGRKSSEKGYDVVQSLCREGVSIAVSLDEGWDKREFYHQLAQTEIVVNPVLQETFGIGMMEALASNVPVIVSDVPQFQTTVPDKYRIPPQDFADKAKFLRHVERILSQAGDERKIAEKYDYRSVLGQWFS